MANRWGFELANQKRGGELKKRDFKNVKVILLSDLINLASRVV